MARDLNHVGCSSALGRQSWTGLRLRLGVSAGRSVLEVRRWYLRLRPPRAEREQLLREERRMPGRHLPMQRQRQVRQLVLRVRREAGLRRRLGRTMLERAGQRRVSATGVQVRRQQRLRVKGGDLRREAGLSARRGRGGLQRSTK